MPIWHPTAVSQVPQLVLCGWLAIRTERNEVHLVGYDVTEREARVSSPVVAFVPATRIATTRSGRRYCLEGPPGIDADADYVFARWRRLSQVQRYEDVTTELMPAALSKQRAGQRPRRARRRRTTA